MEFVILFGALIVGFFAGWQFRELWAMRQVRLLLQEGQLQVKEEDEERTKMRLEFNSGTIFAYSEEDGSFIAQGADLNALDRAIQARFPGRKFSVKEDNLNEMIKNESV